MQHVPRPIAALAVVGALSLLAAGCSAGGDDPTPSPTRSASATATTTPSPSASETASAAPTQGAGDDSGSDDDTGSTPGPDDSGDAGEVPSAFPGSGETNQPDTPASDYPATALVTFAAWDAGSRTLQAGGLVSGTTDTSGTCTFTATKAGVSRTLTSSAQASASSVNCAQVSFPASQVPAGTWSVTLKYSVGSQSTTSDPMTAEVP